MQAVYIAFTDCILYLRIHEVELVLVFSVVGLQFTLDIMADGEKSSQNVINLQQVNVLNVEVMNVAAGDHVTQANLSGSCVDTMVVAASPDEGRVSSQERGFGSRNNSNTYDETEFSGEEWTRLSGTIFMYNAKPLRPRTFVYKAKQRHVSGRVRDVVVKLLEENETCTDEVDILLKLTDHPNIVNIIDSGNCRGTVPQIFITMELCLQNLNDYIVACPFSFPKAIAFLQQTVLAIVYIHDNNIAHRDLKPSNILITLDGNRVKVSDFGISKVLQGDRTRVAVTNPTAGTEGFKAPETYLGAVEIGYRADIYSLGLNGHIIVTHGLHPFGTNPYKWPAYIMDDMNCDLSDVPDFPNHIAHKRTQLISLFQRMLSFKPSDRPTAQQVRDDVCFKGLYPAVDESLPGRSEAGAQENPLQRETSNDQESHRSQATGHPTQDQALDADIKIETAKELKKRSSKLLHKSKFREAVEILRKLHDSYGCEDKMTVALQIAECEIRLKSDKVKESVERVKLSAPKSVSDLVNIAHDLNYENFHIHAVILYALAGQQHEMQDLSPDKIECVSDLIYYICHSVERLTQSNGKEFDATLQYGLNCAITMLTNLRAAKGEISDDVRALTEARCLYNISCISIDVREYQIAMRFCEEGLACLEKEFGGNANKCDDFYTLLNNLGVAQRRLGHCADSERSYVKSLEAIISGNNEMNIEDTEIIQHNLKVVHRKLDKLRKT